MGYADQGTATVRRRMAIIGGEPVATITQADALRFAGITGAFVAAGLLLAVAGHLVLGPPKR